MSLEGGGGKGGVHQLILSVTISLIFLEIIHKNSFLKKKLFKKN